MIQYSGLPWSVLKPTFYMQNLIMAARTIASDGVIYWDTGEGKPGMIDLRDIVEAAFAVLTGSGQRLLIATNPVRWLRYPRSPYTPKYLPLL